MADNRTLPDWLITQTVSIAFVFPVCLLILGVGFWKVVVITVIVCSAMLLDFCRKFFVGVGGLILTLVLLRWVGVDTDSMSAWIHRVFY